MAATAKPASLQQCYALRGKRVWVAGHGGMVGSALVRRLAAEDCEILTADRRLVDLRHGAQVERWMRDARPAAIFMAAAKVGGILANKTYPAEFLYDNLAIATNVIHGAWKAGAEKLLFLGSSCIYPRHAPQPMGEDSLLSGPLEPTNEAYAVAKIAGMKLAEAYRSQYGCDFISAVPTNLYGPGDDFDLLNSHVLPALIRRAHDAKLRGDAQLAIWGTGTPRREFLHVDDCADALVHLMKVYSDAEPINVGSGEDLTIRELAQIVATAVGFTGEIVTDPDKPDGAPRKLLNIGKLERLGWRPRIDLREGIARTYRWYLQSIDARPAPARVGRASRRTSDQPSRPGAKSLG
jgi:GDP-L-fucose synthase